MGDDGVYDYWEPWSVEYDAVIGNGHGGSVREGEFVSLNKLHVSCSISRPPRSGTP